MVPRDPAATGAAIVDGWFRTGDLGYVDEDGFIFVVDRKTELIISAGHNDPREVERALRTTCPRSLECRDALPKNAAGKILKWEL